ncbi:YfeC-like transcriptional regulator [Rhodococcoides fascians]|uniref:YfeC-like transcriptional regulator n=1 Tax=Rhodococcoides fascians TaxID=1828 RepID=UPI001D2A6852|nr:YfeC-like transcriptional regulator [Rhodococcus fascians]CAH0302468.1 hypothetical protein SRABI91_04596 [Rhodococcus fascians]
MATREYEISFVVDPIEDPFDDRIDAVMDRLPGAVIASHGDLSIATTLVQAEDAVEAGLKAARELDACGLPVHRTSLDLVTRQDIADRVGVSRQAVGNWARGDRHESDPFPGRHSSVAGGVWLWADVASWLTSRGLLSENVAYPSSTEHAVIDACLVGHASGLRTQFVTAKESLPLAPQHSKLTFTWGVADSNQRDYTLAS